MTWDSASSGGHVAYVVLLEIALEEPVYIHSGLGLLTWDSKDWLGVGSLGSIESIRGGVDMEAPDVEMTLSGVPSDYRAYLLNTIARGAVVTIRHGFHDEAAGTWSHEPELAYAGFIDTAELTDQISEDGGASVSIKVGVISAASYARRQTISRRTDANQQDLYPGDKFFSFKTDMRIPVATASGPSWFGFLGGQGSEFMNRLLHK